MAKSQPVARNAYKETWLEKITGTLAYVFGIGVPLTLVVLALLGKLP